MQHVKVEAIMYEINNTWKNHYFSSVSKRLINLGRKHSQSTIEVDFILDIASCSISDHFLTLSETTFYHLYVYICVHLLIKMHEVGGI